MTVFRHIGLWVTDTTVIPERKKKNPNETDPMIPFSFYLEVLSRPQSRKGEPEWGSVVKVS